jgi:organic radical activating enzyme
VDCGILRSLYIKANGQILCDDDMGEQILLGLPDYKSTDTGIHDVLNNENYRHIRESFRDGKEPWPGVCNKCALFRPNQGPGPDLLKARVIDKLQLESSLACALRCPSCSNLSQLRTRAAPRHFPVDWLDRLLADLAGHGYQIGTLEFCGQGEPLNHTAFPDLLSVVRRHYPQTRLRIITNGNHNFEAKIAGHFVEETIVSIDGAAQETYQMYRVNGKFDKAIEFLRSSANHQIPRGGRVIWKYILFSSNDSDSEILEAQRLASELDISRLWFVHGHGAMRSERFKYENALSIPIRYPKVKIASHPSFNRASRSFNAVGPARLVSGPHSMVWIDTLVLHPNRTLTLTGWANSVDPGFSELRLRIGGEAPMRVPLDLARPEIRSIHAVFARDLCGFDVLVSDPRPSPDEPLKMAFELDFPNREVPWWRNVLARLNPAWADRASILRLDWSPT